MKSNFENGKLTLVLEGRIDSNNAADFEKQIMEEVDKVPQADIVMDAEKLEYISSAGLRVLMKLRKKANKVLPVINVSPEIYDIFEVTGFSELLDVKKRLREISVEGCEMIGSGGYGKVYRLDSETIAKIYSPSISLEFVEKERDNSQKAFLMGVPTAISYDVVKCNDSYGVVYELLDAQTTAQIISKEPERIPEISSKCALLLKELHKIEPGEDSGLPKRKDTLLNWLDTLTEYITEAEAGKIRDFIQSIPDRNTFLHGDFNSKNIMMRDGEFQLIDIGDAAIGHPVFDIAGLMLAYIILPASRGGIRSDEEIRGLLGFDFEYADKVWGVMCGTYFGLSDPEAIGAMTKKLMLYCLLLMTYQAVTVHGNDKTLIQRSVDNIVRGRLLPAIEHAQPLDF